MNDISGTEPESAQTQKKGHKMGNNNSGKKSSDFVVGLVTFIIFIFFMTAWMYFST